jgi:hypothetical protein
MKILCNPLLLDHFTESSYKICFWKFCFYTYMHVKMLKILKWTTGSGSPAFSYIVLFENFSGSVYVLYCPCQNVEDSVKPLVLDHLCLYIRYFFENSSGTVPVRTCQNVYDSVEPCWFWITLLLTSSWKFILYSRLAYSLSSL